jgi:ACR3 family arsenite transporter
MSKFEKYLALWVALCMVVGVVLSQTVPGISEAINSWQVRGISIPIGICLFLMMYPALLNLQLSELKKLRDNPRPILMTLFSNWIVAPLVAAVLAHLFLQGNEQLIVAVILLGSSPCTAMVLVWGKLAEGNQEQNVVNTSLNTITIMVLYVPIVSLLTGIQNIPIDRGLLAISAFVFIGLPLVLGIVSKRALIGVKGKAWFENVYRPAVGKVAIGALLMTLIVLFSLNGQVLIDHFDQLLLVSCWSRYRCCWGLLSWLDSISWSPGCSGWRTRKPSPPSSSAPPATLRSPSPPPWRCTASARMPHWVRRWDSSGRCPSCWDWSTWERRWREGASGVPERLRFR